MTKNVGTIDKTIRIIAGLVIASLTFWGPKSPWYLLGLLLTLTGICGYCPPYTWMGINTCKKKGEASEG